MTLSRLAWEPEGALTVEELEEKVRYYTVGKGEVTIFKNGSLLFVKSRGDPVAEAKFLMEAAKKLFSYTVVPLRDGSYMVSFHKAVGVLVGANEFAMRRDEILERLPELMFLGEVFDAPQDASDDHALVGAYARGKLQRDAHTFAYHKRI